MNGFLYIIAGFFVIIIAMHLYFLVNRDDMSIIDYHNKQIEMYDQPYQNPGIISPFGGCYYPCYHEA